MRTKNHSRTTLTVEEAAQWLGIGRTLAYELARRGELPGVLRLGRVYRVSIPALEKTLGIGPITPSSSSDDGKTEAS